MSRRNRGTTFVNNVRGPTSALTSFLNERGIRRANPAPVPTPSPPRTPANEQEEEQQQVEEELNGGTEASSSSRPTRTTRLTRGRTVSSAARASATTSVSVDVGGASDEDDEEDEDEDEDEEVDLVPITVTMRSTRSTRTRATATSRSSVATASRVTVAIASSSTTGPSAASASKKRPRKKDVSDDSNDEEFHDITGYVSRSNFSHKGRMPQGSNKIEFCSRCRGRFTVKAGTAPAVDEDTGGILCSNCAGTSSASNATPASKPVKRPRRKAQKAEIECQVPSLQDLCIQKIASCIEDVEAFGDISDISLDKICRIICRNRSLTTDTVQLFLDSRNMDLRLYDCTDITADGLRNIAQFCPNLRSLTLTLCGRINNDVMNYYADQLSDLTSFSLVGPILITDAAYIKLFEAVGDRFERFELKNSSRFSIKALETLCEKCPNLTHLRLSDCNLMDDDWLTPIATLKHLTSLRLRNPERDRLTTESIVKLIQAVGSNLEELELKGCTDLEDAVLLDGIRANCACLQKLNIMDCEEFTTEGITTLFKDWSLNRGLTYLNLENCVMLKDEALIAVTEHSGVTLDTLSIKGMDEITKDALLTLTLCENLTHLDASWCRAMDDEVLEQLVKAAPKLKKVMVWGDHRLTECCPTKQGLKIVGREGDYIDLRFF